MKLGIVALLGVSGIAVPFAQATPNEEVTQAEAQAKADKKESSGSSFQLPKIVDICEIGLDWLCDVNVSQMDILHGTKGS